MESWRERTRELQAADHQVGSLESALLLPSESVCWGQDLGTSEERLDSRDVFLSWHWLEEGLDVAATLEVKAENTSASGLRGVVDWQASLHRCRQLHQQLVGHLALKTNRTFAEKCLFAHASLQLEPNRQREHSKQNCAQTQCTSFCDRTYKCKQIGTCEENTG